MERHRHLGDAADRLPRTRLGPAQPRAARLPAGASYSGICTAANRVRYPLVRGRLLRTGAGGAGDGPSGRRRASIVETSWRLAEGPRHGCFMVRRAGTRSTRSSPPPTLHDQKHGPDRVIGFSPIPAMSMVSYAAGSRYLSLMGGVPSSTTGTATCPRRARRSGASRRTCLSRPTGTTRPSSSPGAPTFRRRARRRALLHRGPLHKGTKTVAVTPDYSEGRKLADHLDEAEAGHRRRRRDGDGPRDPEEFYSTRPGAARTSTTTAAASPTCRCS